MARDRHDLLTVKSLITISIRRCVALAGFAEMAGAGLLVLMASCTVGVSYVDPATVAVLNRPPFIEDVELDPGRLACAGAPIGITATRSDPDGDAIAHRFTMVAAAARDGWCLVSKGAQAAFVAGVPGRYEIALLVDDGAQRAALSFQLHVRDCAARTPSDSAGDIARVAVPGAPWVSGECGCSGDLDCDGVADEEDVCPNSPAGVFTAAGCSAAEAIRVAPALSGAMLRRVTRVAAELGGDEAFTPAAAAVGKAAAELEAATDLAGAGEICRAAERYTAGAEELLRAHEEVESLIADLAENPLPMGVPDPDHRPKPDEVYVPDVTPTELRRADLLAAAARVDDAFAATRPLDATLGAACDAKGDMAQRSGRIAEIDDAAGTLRLADGHLIHFGHTALPDELAEGVLVDATVVTYRDGSDVLVDGDVDDAAQPAPGVEIIDHEGPLRLGPCIAPRYAPVQRFDQFRQGPPTLYDVAAYDFNGDHRLEREMRVAVAPRECFTGVTGEGIRVAYDRHSMRISASYLDKDGVDHRGVTVAPDLTVFDEPAPLPENIALNQPFTLDFTARTQRCIPLLGDAACNTPVTEFTWTYTVRLRGKNGYCPTTVYDETVLVIEDDDPNDFDTTRVIDFVPFLIGGVDPAALSFQAEGYLAVGTPSRPQVLPIFDNVPFAVFNDDFFDPDLLYSRQSTGVDHPAGLMWPRVRGVRNGHEFHYSCQLPLLIRDAVDRCPSGPDAYYRLPFAPPGYPLWTMGQGNNGSFTHNGNRKYAFDFRAPYGAEIRAARGGRVLTVNESNTDNCFSLAGGNGSLARQLSQAGVCPANLVQILHADGQVSRYFHMLHNGILVAKDQEVLRGDPLGLVGSTGFSTNPHVHFEVMLFGSTATVPSSFQADDRTCFVPQEGDILLSNNN